MLPLQTTLLRSISPSSAEPSQSQDVSHRNKVSFEDTFTADRLADQRRDAEKAEQKTSEVKEGHQSEKDASVVEDARKNDASGSGQDEVDLENSDSFVGSFGDGNEKRDKLKSALPLNANSDVPQDPRSGTVLTEKMPVLAQTVLGTVAENIPKVDTSLTKGTTALEAEVMSVPKRVEGTLPVSPSVNSFDQTALEKSMTAATPVIATKQLATPVDEATETAKLLLASTASEHVQAAKLAGSMQSTAGQNESAVQNASALQIGVSHRQQTQVLSAEEHAKRDGLDVDIRSNVITKETTPKTPTHPLQSILHAQMPEQSRKAAALNGLDFNSEIKTIRADAAGDELMFGAKVSTQLTTQAIPRVEYQMAIPRQLADAVRAAQAGDKVIEVAMNPSELGRVRMTMSPAEVGLAINIMAERGETLDLLRRNIQDLHQSFAEMGYEDISFSFGQEQSEAQDGLGQGDTSDDAPHQSGDVPLALDPAPPALPSLAHTSSGIDIRV